MSNQEHKSLSDILEQKRVLEIEEKLAVQNAYKSGNAQDIYKAEQYINQLAKQKGLTADNGKSVLIDPFNRNVNFGFYEKPSTLSFGMLRAMSRTPIPRAILKTRKEQVKEFTVPQNDKYRPGFVIRKKKKTYKQGMDDKLSKQEEREVDMLTEFMLNCGEDSNKWAGDDFEGFVDKLVDDSLGLDQGCFEIVRGRKQSLDNIQEFYMVDGASIRIADSYQNETTGKNERMPMVNGYYPAYVQLIEGQIQTEFYPWELCFGVRNKQTDLRSNGYGLSENETLISTVTDLLNASQYNSQYFKIGSNPKGILRVKNMNTTRIEEFRNHWIADMAGVKNAHKLPIIDADTMDFITTQQSNKDMEYQKYLEFLIKVACAIYTISPEEIGFPLEGVGSGKGLGGGDNETELEYSKSKGLNPLLRYIQAKVNKYIIGPKTGGKYEFVFLGLDSGTERDELEDDIKKVQNGAMSQQDLYKKYSNKEPNFEEDIILNPIYLQYKQMMAMGNPQSNEWVDGEYGNDANQDEDNPFLKKSIKFVDEELNHSE